MSKTFGWKRFWCPRGKTIDLSDGGFLYGPDSKYGKYANPHLVSFDALVNVPALALLGEPGIGKSWALNNEQTNLQLAASREGGKTLWLDLRSFGSEERLWKALFENEEIKEWRTSDFMLNIVLDSLDECLLRIDTVAALIADQIPKEPAQRLRFRIACRTAQWPSVLETSLLRAFPPNGFQAFELAPLRREDVISAAQESGINEVAAFLARIETLDVTSLAIKPVTLRFLINTYVRDGDLPADQLELYEKGCRILCEEPNESRLSAAQRGQLSTSQRLAVASRIAAMTQFANRYAVWTQDEGGLVSQEDILISDVVGGEEAGAEKTIVTSDAVRETLNTGLFSSRGFGRIGWAHQTYAEFLAARHSKTHDMPPQQISSLLFHPEGSRQQLVPQLHETAAWISVMNPAIFRIVSASDPEALLGSAAASLSQEQRGLVTQAILDQSDNGRPFNLRWQMFHLYRRVRHPGLPEQLRPYLTDKNRKTATRDVAIDIARLCGLRELGSELADIALDLSEEMNLRNPAAHAVAALGSAEMRARLRPLAFGQVGDDPDDELKGSGLRALWPGLIGSKELFPLITPPKRPNLHGAYSSFLYDGLAPHLKVEDLSPALEWVSNQAQDSLGPLDSLKDDIVRFTWANLEAPGAAAGLAAVVLSKIKVHGHLMSRPRSHVDIKNDVEGEMATEHKRRQLLLAEVLPHLKENDVFFLDFAGIPLVPEQDLPWLLQRITTGQSPTSVATEAALVWRTVDTRDPEQMRILRDACAQNSTLDAKCRSLFEPPIRDSTQAQAGHEIPPRSTEQALNPPPSERIEEHLRQIDRGDLFQWVRLTLDLALGPTKSEHADGLNPDLTVMTGWHAANKETKEKIIAAALRYVTEGEPDNDKWAGTSQIYWSAIAGFKALALILRMAPQKLDALDVGTWRKWVPILLQYPNGDTDEFQPQSQLLQKARLLVPDEIAQRLGRLIDSQMAHGEHFLLQRELDLCWSPELEIVLVRIVQTSKPKPKPSFLRGILEPLLRRGAVGARELAKSFIPNPPPDSEPERSTVMAAIKALVSGTSDSGWSDIWPIITDNPQFGSFAIESLAYRYGGLVPFLSNLAESQLGDLYIWMLRTYPPSSHDHQVAGAIGPKQAAVMFRDQIIEHLKNRRTFAACQAIRRTIDTFPQYGWLALPLEEAETLARAATWQPLMPQELLSLVSNPSKRLVASELELVEVTLESLDRLQLKLKRDLPAAKDLWNANQGRYWPKDEEDLSDYVARHLREDVKDRGIVANREVQIRRGIGSGTGQFTDIHINAVVPGSQPTTYSSVSIIVEAKGSWNPQLFENMRTQLRDRYLKDLPFRCGIYLIGWFSCVKWDDVDGRKKQCPALSLDEVREKFSQQATELSTEGYTIKSYILDCSLT